MGAESGGNPRPGGFSTLLQDKIDFAGRRSSTEPAWPTAGLRLAELLVEISIRENILPVWSVIELSPALGSIM